MNPLTQLVLIVAATAIGIAAGVSALDRVVSQCELDTERPPATQHESVWRVAKTHNFR